MQRINPLQKTDMTYHVTPQEKEDNIQGAQREAYGNSPGAEYAEMQKALIKIGAQENNGAPQKPASDIKSLEFETMLAKRSDIPEKARLEMKKPEDLYLFDAVKKALCQTGAKEASTLAGNFVNSYTDSSAKLEIIPNLILKGYEPEFLSRLYIKDYNKNQVEPLLENKELIEREVEKKVAYEITNSVESYKRLNPNVEDIDKIIEDKTNYHNSKREEYRINIINDILHNIDDENAKYLDECLDTTGKTTLLPYWREESKEIYTTLFKGLDKRGCEKAFDRILRRNHTIETIKQISSEGELTETTERLLEFKNYKKFKNIDTSNFNTLSTAEKKEFLNAFISTIDPKEVLYDRNFIENFHELTSRMKIYEEIYSDDPKEIIKNYQNVTRKMLDKIPPDEKEILTDRIEYGNFMKDYRSQNPLPPMTDDISRLPYKTESVSSRKFKVATIDFDTKMGIATHRIPNGEAILNVEALQITDPRAVFCVGLKGGENKLNFDPNGYALAIKPRLGNDWWLQSETDIDSGNGAEKNIYNIDHYCLRVTPPDRTVTYIPELIKKELNLSTNEYAARTEALKDCTTLDEVREIDPEFEGAIRKVLMENSCYEGIVRPEVMGVCIASDKNIEEVCPDILNYCERYDIPLIRVVKKEEPKKPVQPQNRTFTISID